MSALFYIGLGLTLAVIVGLAIWTGAHAARGRRTLSTPLVAGAIMGTLVGGSSTVGTAQLAFQFGFSAWWFTLGAGIACLFLALVYAKPLRRANCPTLVGIIRREFGDAAGMLASILSAVGTFINVISQLISATAVIAVVVPALGTEIAVAIAVVFMILYVIFGGAKGAGFVGIVKMALLYISMLACGVLVLHRMEFANLVKAVPKLSLFARGVGTDGGACLSLILGVLTNQMLKHAPETTEDAEIDSAE
jgi:SSS family solute:Na+ symporter